MSYLEHHGVKGMHWGVRKDSDSLQSISKQAKKDAIKYHASRNATMSFKRRAAMKNEIKNKAKNNPYYAKEFNRHLADARNNTETAKHIPQSLKKTIKGADKRISGIKRSISGNNIVVEADEYRKKSIKFISDHSLTVRGYKYLFGKQS